MGQVALAILIFSASPLAQPARANRGDGPLGRGHRDNRGSQYDQRPVMTIVLARFTESS